MIQQLGPETYKTDHMIIKFEPPDLLFMATEGHVEKQDMIEMVDVLEKRIRDWPH
jgi:hypothetical protein